MSKNTIVHTYGINDLNEPVNINGKLTPHYVKWTSMLSRCYSPSVHKRDPSYIGVTTCDEWLYFSNFKRWMDTQDWIGKELDKDIINPSNKVYSPDNCCFVPKALNMLMNTSGTAKGYYYSTSRGKYQAQIKIHDKTKNLGRFIDEVDARNAYIEAKVEYIKSFIPTGSKRVDMGLEKHIDLLNRS